MNRVQLYGNVGADPDVKTLTSGKTVTKFSLATNKSYTNSTEDHRGELAFNSLWGKVAETASKYVKKGSSIIIEGEISYRSYENKEGVTVYVTEIVGHNMHFTGSKPEGKPVEQKSSAMSDINELPGAIESAENDPSYLPE